MDVLPKEIFTTEYNPPMTDGSGFMRLELQKAALLLQNSGWELIDRKLINKKIMYTKK